MRTYIEFEKPIAELESKVAELRSLSSDSGNVSLTDEIMKLEQRRGSFSSTPMPS